MKIVHVVSDIDESFGGPSRSVPELCKSLNAIGVENTIFYTKHLKENRNEIVSRANLDVVAIPLTFSKSLYFSAGLLSALRQQVRRRGTHLIHIHSMWRYNAYAAYNVARENQIPHVVSPRSNLYAQSLERSAFRKRIMRRIFVDKMLDDAAFIHATAASEATAVAGLGLKAPVRTIPNGVDFKSTLSAGQAKQLLGLPENARVLSFISRIHPRKRLLELMRAFCELAPKHPGWIFMIAGPAEDPSYLRAVLDVAQSAGQAHRVVLKGMLRDDKRIAAYGASDLFALPSEFENFGMSIAEALSSGIPVIVSNTTPWTSVENLNAGWIVPATGEAQLKSALDAALSLPETRLRVMGERGKEVVSQFSWGVVAKDMKAAYEGAISGCGICHA